MTQGQLGERNKSEGPYLDLTYNAMNIVSSGYLEHFKTAETNFQMFAPQKASSEGQMCYLI